MCRKKERSDIKNWILLKQTHWDVEELIEKINIVDSTFLTGFFNLTVSQALQLSVWFK